MIEDASRTAQRSQHLEQVSLHLLAAEGELAAYLDIDGARDAHSVDHVSRLRSAHQELQQAQMELHRVAKLTDRASLTSKNLMHLLDERFAQADDLTDDIGVLSEATRTLRALHVALGGRRDDDEEEGILSQAERKRSLRRRLAWAAGAIWLIIYVPYVMNQYQTRPERIERAALIESQTLCEAFTNCAALPKSIVLGCIPKEPWLQRLVASADFRTRSTDILHIVRLDLHSCLYDFATQTGMKPKQTTK